MIFIAPKKGFNNYWIENNIGYFEIVNRKGIRKIVKVDKEDLFKLIKLDYHWYFVRDYKDDLFYIRTTERYIDDNGKSKGRVIQLQRLLMNADPKMLVDHINHDTFDNRKENLRVTEIKKNTKNRKSRNKNNTSGYRNVSKIGKWWCVQMQVDGKHKILKKFPLDQLDEAGIYAELMRNQLYGEYAGES